MKSETTKDIAAIINDHSTWIAAEYNSCQTPYLRLIDGNVSICYSASLILRVVIAQHGYGKRQRWIIPEYKLELSVHKQKEMDATLQKRILNRNMTCRDVERIILDATYGLVNLELDNYNPIHYNP